MPEQTTTQTAGEQQLPETVAGKSLADIIEMASLRWQLAELELRSDCASARRLGLVGGAGLVAVIASIPVLTIVLAGQLDAGLGNSFPWVTLSAGCLFLVGGLLAAWLGWRRFRGEFLGLRESLEECHEDLIWLREWGEERS